MVRRLTRDEMLTFMQNVLEPSEDSSEEEVTDQLNLICLNSPDPVTAFGVITETPPPVTAVELVERILALPRRDPATVPESELPLDHPYRRLKLDAP